MKLALLRASFEELNVDLFIKCIGLVDRVFQDSRLSKEAVDEIILVGGSTHIPKVQKMLQDFFGGKELNKSINPEEVVAHGAAIQAAILSGTDQENKIQQLDTVPLSIGIETMGGIMTTLIERGTSIPAKQSQFFSTSSLNQQKILVKVYEGERAFTKDNNLIGEIEFEYLDLNSQVPLNVAFDIDSVGNLIVSVLDLSHYNEYKIQIENYKDHLTKEYKHYSIQCVTDAKINKVKDTNDLDDVKNKLKQPNALENETNQIVIQDEPKQVEPWQEEQTKPNEPGYLPWASQALVCLFLMGIAGAIIKYTVYN